MEKKTFVLIIVSVFLLIAIAISVLIFFSDRKTDSPLPTTEESSPEPIRPEEPQRIISDPISNARDRVTKKPFGIYVTPQSSPVKSEKFTGYHTGTDFETSPAEASIEVPVYAICSGKIKQKQVVEGYGGVIIQDCTIDDQAVTILYGHLDIDESAGAGTEIVSGEKLSALAPAESNLSGGERKHLHLGIHKGTQVDYRGYVGNESALVNWLDVKNYL